MLAKRPLTATSTPGAGVTSNGDARHAGYAADPGTAGVHNHIGLQLVLAVASAVPHPYRPYSASGGFQPHHLTKAPDVGAVPPGRRQKLHRQPPGIDGAVRDQDSQPDIGVQAGLHAESFTPREPPGGYAAGLTGREKGIAVRGVLIAYSDKQAVVELNGGRRDSPKDRAFFAARHGNIRIMHSVPGPAVKLSVMPASGPRYELAALQQHGLDPP